MRLCKENDQTQGMHTRLFSCRRERTSLQCKKEMQGQQERNQLLPIMTIMTVIRHIIVKPSLTQCRKDLLSAHGCVSIFGNSYFTVLTRIVINKKQLTNNAEDSQYVFRCCP